MIILLKIRTLLAAPMSLGVFMGCMLFLAVPASAAVPTPFLSTAGTCSDDVVDWATAAASSSHDDYLVRYTTQGGPSTALVYGTSYGIYSNGSDSIWSAAFDGDHRYLSAGESIEGSVGCYGSNLSFTVAFLDPPATPTAFSGSSSYSTYFGGDSIVAFAAPGEGQYVADLTLGSGAVTLQTDGFDREQTFASSGQFDLGTLGEGIHPLRIQSEDGPKATWSLSIHALPVVLSGVSFAPSTAKPGDIMKLKYTASGDTSISAKVKNDRGDVVRVLAQNLDIAAGSRSLTWDGRDSTGANVPDGTYTAYLVTKDPSGSTGGAEADAVINLPPRTKLTSRPSKRLTHARARFRFASNDNSATFECKLGGGWTPCTSPQKFTLRPGSYRFSVRARDEFGAVDRTPASARFRVVR